jgi:hypothetical protein
MDRVLRNTAANIQATFALDGVPTDATGDVRVTVTASDGTVLVNNAVADKPASTTGVYRYPLTPVHTALLDTLTAAWTGTISGVAQTVQTVVEVVGGFVFSLALARALPELSRRKPAPNQAEYAIATSDIVAMRTLVEDALEREIGYALVPRYSLDWLDSWGTAWGEIPLRPYTTAVRTLTIDGAAATGMTLRRPGTVTPTLRYSIGFSRWSDAVIGIEHGQVVLDPEATQAALSLAKVWITRGPVDDRTTAAVTDDGTFTLATPGRGGSIFGLPSVDSWAQRASLRAGVA